jgi:hypothetical protein
VSDPGRIRDGGSEVPSELKDLFAAAPKPEPLPTAIDARVAAQIGTLGALPASPLVKLVPWLVGGGAIVVAGAVTLVVQRRAPGPPVASTQPNAIAAPAETVLDPTPSVLTESATPPAEAKALPRPGASHTAPAEASSASDDALAGEAKLLNQAHDAMSTDPRKALTIAGEHAKLYPHGQLAAERELILVQALVKLGRVREAEARGRALRKSTPNSIYGERLDTILHGK